MQRRDVIFQQIKYISAWNCGTYIRKLHPTHPLFTFGQECQCKTDCKAKRYHGIAVKSATVSEPVYPYLWGSVLFLPRVSLAKKSAVEYQLIMRSWRGCDLSCHIFWYPFRSSPSKRTRWSFVWDLRASQIFLLSTPFSIVLTLKNSQLHRRQKIGFITKAPPPPPLFA